MNGRSKAVTGRTPDKSEQKSKKSIRRRPKQSKSADPCPECAANGGPPPPQPPVKEEPQPLSVCHCVKCQPAPQCQECPTTPLPSSRKAVVISAEGDSSSSRSTLKGRARSWPLLVQPEGSKEVREPHLGLPSPVAQVRRLLWRHYYPEGGWGYIVVGCCMLVQVLNHGLQLSFGVMVEPISKRFDVGMQESGE